MSGRVIAIGWALAAATGVADAQPADPAVSAVSDPAPAVAPITTSSAPISTTMTSQNAPEDDEIGDQGISAQLGVASGSRVTPGGVRVAGHYLYQLSDQDWFDGMAAFTFGSGHARCFRDRDNSVVCDHGLADGAGVEVSANVRRMFAPQGSFRPYARVGIGLGLARFSDDDVSGFVVPIHGGGGVRAKVAPSIAVVAEGEVVLGFGSFNRGIGFEPQLGLAITAGVEFRLR